jgi:hypothetical protein
MDPNAAGARPTVAARAPDDALACEPAYSSSRDASAPSARNPFKLGAGHLPCGEPALHRRPLSRPEIGDILKGNDTAVGDQPIGDRPCALAKGRRRSRSTPARPPGPRWSVWRRDARPGRSECRAPRRTATANFPAQRPRIPRSASGSRSGAAVFAFDEAGHPITPDVCNIRSLRCFAFLHSLSPKQTRDQA